MLHNPTLEKLHALRLTGMAQALSQQLAQPAQEALSFEERFGYLLEQEILYRDNRRLSRLLKPAKLRVSACIEDIDYRHPRGIDAAHLRSLSTCQWVSRAMTFSTNVCAMLLVASNVTVWTASGLGL